MKVEEAKTKICPFIVRTEVQNWNSGFMYDTENIKCICGDCMAWQGMKEKEADSIGCKTGHFEDGKYLDKTDDKNAKYGYCIKLQ